MVRGIALVLIAAAIAIPGGAWQLEVAFTNDLHVALPRLPQIAPLLSQADIRLDAGDAWEDLYRLTDVGEALALAREMHRLDYAAMVLGNHEMYLGPELARVIREAGFPVLATDLITDLPVRKYVLLEANGVRVLVLGFLWTDLPWPLWPHLKLVDPIQAAREALASAPEHDALIFLGHMPLERAKRLAAAFPECDLFILGHDHIWLEEPVWVGGVPIVEAGHRAGAVGLVTLTDRGISYRLVRTPKPRPLPGHVLLALAAFLALALLPLKAGGR
jgi:2',3'-cyclic-nucleotide 2'-phosphodiesterase (5'-nucleotidase family)